jgi:glycosyltransferase involved in cell wall biosynthesis
MRKKALIFIEDNTFTNDNRVIREADALVDAGWQVTVVCPKYPGDPFYKRISDPLRVYFYPKPNAVSAAGHLFEHAVTLLFGALLVFWVQLRHGFQVFQACNPMDTLWILAAPYKLFGKKFIYDQHDLCPELYLSREESGRESLFFKALSFLERMSYRTADAVISTNESYKAIAIDRGGRDLQAVFVVRNGPNLSKFKPVEPRTDLKKDGEFLVGYLGNINLQDGVDRLLIAAKQLVLERGRKDIRFVLVGGGAYQPELVKLSGEMGLSACVTFTGRVSDDEMLRTLCACDICVQPDPYNPLNNLSTMNKVMEYMAINKPVVAFDLKETRFSCGDAALYADPHDTDDLGRKILELTDDAELRGKMAAMGRKRVETVLAWPFSVPHLLAAYDFAMKH